MNLSKNNRGANRFAPTAKRSITRGRAVLAMLCLSVLASDAISLGVSSKHLWQLRPRANAETVTPNASDAKMRTGTSTLPATPTVSLTPDSTITIDSSVIAGGGDHSDSGGTAPTFTLDSTIGEPAAGTVSSGGNFMQGGGFDYASSSNPLPPPPVCISVTVPTGMTALSGANLSVPINVSDTTGQNILSFDFTFTYDPNVLTPLDTPYDQTGTISSGFTITLNANTSGQLKVSGFNTDPLSGSGTLINLSFNVSGSPANCTNLNLATFQFNEGTPCSPVTNGSMCIATTISGTVTYGVPGVSGGSGRPGGPGGQPVVIKPVPDVGLFASGSPSVPRALTNAFGLYTLTGFGGGAYTVSPTKNGDINGINAYDAALVAQHVVGLDGALPNTTPLTANQLIAADASNDGTISSFDAALIALLAVHAIPPPDVIDLAGRWKFLPPNRTYATTTLNYLGENYQAILIGDVSGNWTAGAGPPSIANPEGNQTVAAAAIPVSLPNLGAAQGASITIPITSGDVSNQNVISYDLNLAFDPNVIQPQASPVDTSGTITTGLNITVNSDVAGHVRIAAFGPLPLTGAGTLLNLKFAVVGTPGATTPLLSQRFEYNEGNPSVTVTNGQFSVALPTSSSGTIGGTILDQDGKPVAGVAVRLSGGNQNNQNRLTITDSNGAYQFDSVETNALYTVVPSRANYLFGPSQRSVSTFNLHTDAAFTATLAGGGSNPLDTT
ncbi:MAG TPA: cohesin domain-containing protein, partial [Pyrinomonadaceae bacterium]|nr:cohesin domain-containing protein [Pyrinomonadaceae bacterium]